MKDSRSFALLRMTRVKGFGLSGDCSCALEKQIPFEDDRKKSKGNGNGNCKSKGNGRSKGKCSAGAKSLVLPVVPRTYQDHGSCR